MVMMTLCVCIKLQTEVGKKVGKKGVLKEEAKEVKEGKEGIQGTAMRRNIKDETIKHLQLRLREGCLYFFCDIGVRPTDSAE